MLPASNLDGLLCAFDQSNTYFAVSTPDGRVRTFDTGEPGRRWPTKPAGSLHESVAAHTVSALVFM